MIYTPRLTLRAPTDNDVEALAQAKQEVWSELQKWMSWACDGQESLEATKQYISFTKEQAEKGSVPLIGVCRRTDEFVVASGLDLVEGKQDEYATGYWVSKSFLGKGYATEACNAVIRYAFESLEAKKVHIDYFEGNVKSRKIIEKLGFQYVRTREKAHKCFLDGEIVDVFEYELESPSNLPNLDISWDN